MRGVVAFATRPWMPGRLNGRTGTPEDPPLVSGGLPVLGRTISRESHEDVRLPLNAPMGAESLRGRLNWRAGTREEPWPVATCPCWGEIA